MNGQLSFVVLLVISSQTVMGEETVKERLQKQFDRANIIENSDIEKALGTHAVESEAMDSFTSTREGDAFWKCDEYNFQDQNPSPQDQRSVTFVRRGINELCQIVEGQKCWDS